MLAGISNRVNPIIGERPQTPIHNCLHVEYNGVHCAATASSEAVCRL